MLQTLSTLQAIHFIELFAGVGNVSKCVRLSGHLAISFDILYYAPKPGKQNYMDILSPSGMA
jgi:hypothetical protein